MAEISKPLDLFKIWALGGDKRVPSDSKIDLGFIVEIPTFQDFNWIEGRQDQALAHINQRGIPEWDAGTGYVANKSYVQSSTGNIYLAKQDNTNQNPLTDTSFVYWGLAFSNQNYFQPQINLTLQSGFSNHASYPQIRASLKDSVLYVNGAISVPTTPSGNLIATLPVGYRPSQDRMAIASIHSISISGQTATLRITSTGQILINEGNWNVIGNNIIISLAVPV